MGDNPKVIQFTASISQFRTMVDGGLRVVLDFDASAIQAATALIKAKQAGAILEIAAVPILPSVTNGKSQTDRRATRSPIDVAGG